MKYIELFMKFLQRLFKSENFLPILLVIVAAILAGRTLFTPGYFNMHDDLQMMRQLEMEKCFKDLQIPCRWVPDMGYGFGFPLFNYYPPLPYLTGEIFRLVGFSFVSTAKILFLLSFIASGVAMYFLAKEFFGKWGGVISAIFYIWAPYHAVDVYVRGAMNESWGLIWFPLIFWTSYRLIKSVKKSTPWIIGLGLSWAGLFISHNLMVLIFTPIFAVWCLIHLFRLKAWRVVPKLIVSGIVSFGLAAFFTLPALFEQKYVQVNTLIMGYYEYIAHFATAGQILFSRFWGYGPSIWGPNDGMSFQIGYIHWILSILILVGFIYRYIKTKKIDNIFILIVFFVLVGWSSAFMIHSKSTFLWQVIPTLKFLQFPWRFLTLVIFSFSFIAGSVVVLFKERLARIISLVLVVGLVLINWNYFLPQGGKMGPLTDQEKFSGAAWDLQRTAGIFDYLPVTARLNPKEPQKGIIDIMEGKAEVNNSAEGTNWARFQVMVGSESSTLRVNIFDYPVWKAFIDGKETGVTVPASEEWGRMYIAVPNGTHEIYLKLYNTPLRTAGNIISLVTWLLLLSFPFWKKRINVKFP